jgi:hypothetical protein
MLLFEISRELPVLMEAGFAISGESALTPCLRGEEVRESSRQFMTGGESSGDSAVEWENLFYFSGKEVAV